MALSSDTVSLDDFPNVPLCSNLAGGLRSLKRCQPILAISDLRRRAANAVGGLPLEPLAWPRGWNSFGPVDFMA